MSTAWATRDEPLTEAPPGARAALLVDPGSFTPFYDLQLAAALGAEGWDVELVTSRYEFEEVASGANVAVRLAFFSRPTTSWRRLRAARLALRAVRYVVDLVRFDRSLVRLSPSIIHVQWAHLPWIDRRFWSRWRRSGWKVVYTAHDVPPLPGTTLRVLARSYSSLMSRADAVVVHSEYGRTAVLETGAVPERVHVIPPASPVSPDSALSRTSARRALGVTLDAPIVLFFGFVKPYKGLSVLLRSLPLLRRSVPPAKVLIAGELMESRRGYDRLTAKLGIAQAVDWRAGFVPSEDVRAYFAAADVVALPYLDASSSGVLLTAYACRRPVVVTSVGALPELVVPGDTGLVVPAGDPSALAEALAELLRDPQRAERMAESGLELVERHYTWSGMAQRLDALYRELLV